jgi:hypothetical protein
MALPTLTPEQRAAALAKAGEVRRARSEMLAAVKAGTLSLNAVLDRAAKGEEMVKKTKVTALIKALPGYGPAKAAKLMADAEIDENRRIGGLGERQRQALLTATS